MIPPMVIFKGERLNYEWTRGEVPDTKYAMSPQGWTDHELFFEWLSKQFTKSIPPSRPVLLLLDGHSSHFTLEAIKFAAENYYNKLFFFACHPIPLMSFSLLM